MVGYEVLRKLADGSAAEVFLAREESTRDRVVLEVIRPEFTSDMDVYGRFLDEAKERQTLSHPNLVRRRSTGCAPDGRLFVVTESVPGEDLEHWLKTNGPMSAWQAACVLRPICDALEYLHSRRLVHGNLRPSNVLLAGVGDSISPKLLDTGLSLFRSTRSVSGPRAMVLVAPEYLAPERVRGHRGKNPSDIYGLGLLLFEMITGRPPFRGATAAETRKQQVEAEPPPVPERCAALGPIIRRCLKKSPHERYGSAAKLRAELDGLLETLSRAPGVAPEEDGPTRVRQEPPPPSLPVLPPPLPPARAAPPPPPGAPVIVGEPVGEVLGSYQLEDLLGTGGMGRVYLARHTQLDRKVALKVLKPELSEDPSQLQRFIQEAKAVNKINHEHIVQIYDFVQDPSGPVYCVMEYLAGQSVKDLMRQGPLPLQRIIHITRQVCAALQATHDVGVVHRDVKPDNLFVIERRGADFVKVLDFGVAKLKSHQDLQNTKTGVVIGTPAYMAPEQALGEQIDHRADIYALGTVLYALVSGKPPFDAKSLGPLVAKLVTQPPPPLADLTAAGEPLPRALQDLIARCLAKRPSDRLQSMAELFDALEPFDTSAAEHRAPAPARPPKPQESRRALWYALAAGLGLVGAGIALAFH